MKYKLINKQTKEKHLCDKVTIDGFDYYVSDEQATEGFYGYIDFQGGDIKKVGKHFADDWRKVIATNNPNLDIPRVVDEVEVLAFKYTKTSQAHRRGFIDGYNKAKETYPFSAEDMIEFAKWLDDNMQQREYYPMSSMNHKELLQLWKSQQPQKIYYTQTIDK